jgi:hypothetical protein
VVIDAFRMINPPGGMMGMSLQPTDPRQTTSNIGISPNLLHCPLHADDECCHATNSARSVLLLLLLLLLHRRVPEEAHYSGAHPRAGPPLLLIGDRLAQERPGGADPTEPQQEGLDGLSARQGLSIWLSVCCPSLLPLPRLILLAPTNPTV